MYDNFLARTCKGPIWAFYGACMTFTTSHTLLQPLKASSGALAAARIQSQYAASMALYFVLPMMAAIVPLLVRRIALIASFLVVVCRSFQSRMRSWYLGSTLLLYCPALTISNSKVSSLP